MRFAFVTLALACLAAATPARRTDVSQCNTGTPTCCESIENSKDLSAKTKELLGLLPIDIDNLVGDVGIDCVLDSCSQQTVCCDDNNFNGLVAIGCTPININL